MQFLPAGYRSLRGETLPRIPPVPVGVKDTFRRPSREGTSPYSVGRIPRSVLRRPRTRRPRGEGPDGLEVVVRGARPPPSIAANSRSASTASDLVEVVAPCPDPCGDATTSPVGTHRNRRGSPVAKPRDGRAADAGPGHRHCHPVVTHSTPSSLAPRQHQDMSIFDDEPIDVTVRGASGDPRAAPVQPGVLIHHVPTLQPDDVTIVSGIPVTSVARTLVDLAEVMTRDELCAAGRPPLSARR